VKKDLAATMEQIFLFLGAHYTFQSPLFRHERHVGWHEPYLSLRGRRLRDSPGMRMIGKLLATNVLFAMKNILLRPFSESAPSMDLPVDLKRRIDERLHAEVQLLRQLAGLPLPSLTRDQVSHSN